MPTPDTPRPERRPASTRLACPPLVNQFIVPVDDGPDIVITAEGTDVVAGQLSRVEDAARASGLTLRVVES